MTLFASTENKFVFWGSTEISDSLIRISLSLGNQIRYNVLADSITGAKKVMLLLDNDGKSIFSFSDAYISNKQPIER